MRDWVEQATMNALIASVIFDARNSAGLTQTQLAGLIGTKQPVIARLEDSNYRGHSLSMLIRIAHALNRRLDIRLMPEKRECRSA